MPRLTVGLKGTPRGIPAVGSDYNYTPAFGPEPAVCANCAATVTGHYCGACGERRLDERDLSLRHYAREAVEAFVDWDAGVPRTLRTLLVQPGRLTADYLAGRRTLHLKPLRLFLLCNVLFFVALAYWDFGVLSLPLSYLYRTASDATPAHRMIARALAARHESLASLSARYDPASESLSRTLVVLLIPTFAVVLQLLHLRAKRYFVEHLVFATHFCAALLLLIVGGYAVTLDVAWLGRAVGHPLSAHVIGDMGFTVLLSAATMAYLTPALRRAYAAGWVPSVARAAAMTLLLVPILQLYRLLLFYLVMKWVA